MMRNDRSRIFTILGSSKSSGAIIRTLSSSHSFQPFPPSPSTSTFTHVSESSSSSSSTTTTTTRTSSSSSTSGGSMSTGSSNNDNSGKSSSSNNSSSSGSSSNSSSKNRNDVSNNKQMSVEMKEMNEMNEMDNEMDNEMEWWKWPNGGYPFSLYFECLSTGSSFNRSQVSYLLPYLTLPSLLYIYNMQRTR
jgi:DNA mismatch repair ATPase MutL